ncbi:MAG: transporter substrate-binding domain-containing protein [Magnetococcales bacterium]|nr:transporter substrate-binding domain-containing protein [Magnetococcales bacterium]
MWNIPVLFISLWAIFFALPKANAEDAKQNLAPAVLLSAIENEQTHTIASAILIEAYKRVGYRAEIDFLPARRALEWAASGRRDGDVARIAGTEKSFPNLIPVPTPVVYFKGVAFAKTDLKRDITNWDDLKGLDIGVIRGIRYSTIGTKGMQPLFAKNMGHLFTLLNGGRIDVAIAVQDAGVVEVNRNFADSGIHIVGKPLYSSPLFHFVHKQNSQLIPLLDSELKKMREQGESKEIYNRVLRLLMQPKNHGK